MPETAPVIDPDYADIVVSCPVPGQEDQPQMTLGDFAETERGQKYAQGVVETSQLYETTGLTKEEAIAKTLGGAAITDENGKLIRRPRGEQTISQSQSEESKKK